MRFPQKLEGGLLNSFGLDRSYLYILTHTLKPNQTASQQTNQTSSNQTTPPSSDKQPVISNLKPHQTTNQPKPNYTNHKKQTLIQTSPTKTPTRLPPSLGQRLHTERPLWLSHELSSKYWSSSSSIHTYIHLMKKYYGMKLGFSPTPWFGYLMSK